MTWILTASGRQFDVRHPYCGNVNLGDIAHSLAQINRFNGHASRPYSVAEHSLLVAEIVRVMGGNPHAQMAGLMHDAHEAYCGDLHSPGKDDIGHDWHLFEDKFSRTVRTYFELNCAFVDHAPLVKRADLIALATERRDLMPNNSAPWECLMGITPDATPLNAPGRQRMTWCDWRDEFIAHFNALEAAMGRTTCASSATAQHTV